MKKLLKVALLPVLIVACSSTDHLISKHEKAPNNYQEVIGEVNENFPEPDQFAQYPDGLNGIYQHILETFRYPEQCRKKNIQGKVVVEFIVEKDGWVKTAKVIESVHPELDKEALRIILALQRFYPGTIDGQPVRVRYLQPVNFIMK